MRRLALLLGLVVAPAMAQTIPGYMVYMDPAVPRVHRLDVGETATFSFRVTANFGTSGTGRAGGLDYGTGAAGYEFVGSPAGTCMPPVFSVRPAPYGYRIVEFPVTPPVDDTPITCTYRVTRTAAAMGDLHFSICSYDYFYCPQNDLWIGSLPDVSLRIEQVAPPAPGASTGLVRIVANNPGARAIAQRGLTTECVEFGGGIFYPAPFEIENDFPGACASDPSAGTGCVSFTGQNFSSQGFRITDIPAGGEASCLLRLRPVVPPTGQQSILFGFARDPFTYAGGGPGFDVGLGNDRAPLGLVPFIAPVPLSRSAALAMVVLLGIAGLLVVRRRAAATR